MMVPIQVIRWYRMQCYDGTDSCAIVVPNRRYYHFDETNVQIRFLPVFDIDCYQSYSLQEIIDIAEAYDQKHGNRYLHWSIPSLIDWKLIISRLGETQVQHGEELSFNDWMEEWEEFDC